MRPFYSAFGLGDLGDAAEIARTANFLGAGGGGVTVSRGEPLAQAEFALDILKGANALDLHTALDTCAIGKSTRPSHVRHMRASDSRVIS